MKIRKTNLLAVLSLLALSSEATAKVTTQIIEYKDGNTVLEGLFSFDDSLPGKRPGVLIVHDWMGVTQHTRDIAEDLARQGYAAFAADIYGKGIRPADTKEAARESGNFKANRSLLRTRACSGLAELKKQSSTDPKQVAAIGFCFGGTTVLELARTGAEVTGVVSFHGGLDSPSPDDGKLIKSKVLVLHGADDPFVKADDLKAFQDEMRHGKVDWQMVYYGNAVHSFTQQKAGTDNSKGAAYNEPAARRSFEAMKQFFSEIFLKK